MSPKRGNKLDADEKAALALGAGFLIFWLFWVGLIVWAIVSIVLWITSK